MAKSISSLYSDDEFELIQHYSDGQEDTANVEEFQRKSVLFVCIMLQQEADTKRDLKDE